ncbi:MAG: hypothetical protein ACKOUM_00735, partial [Sphingopyxis sp.]
AIAAFGGRWWLLVAALSARLAPLPYWLAVGGSTLISVVIAAMAGGSMALQVRGPGMLLLLALALLSAAAGLFWPTKPIKAALANSMRGPVSATIILLSALIGDSAPFIIFAAAAHTGSGPLAAAGGMAGMMAAAGAAAMMGATPLPQPLAQRARMAAGAVFTVIGSVAALVALGLL